MVHGRDDRLPPHARAVIADPGNDVLVSVGSLWEIAIKASLGRLTLGRPFEELFPAHLAAESIEELPIRPAHLEELIRLPFHHRDPFDRLLVAQARVEGLPVVGRDGAFEAYAVELIWSA